MRIIKKKLTVNEVIAIYQVNSVIGFVVSFVSLYCSVLFKVHVIHPVLAIFVFFACPFFYWMTIAKQREVDKKKEEEG